MFTESQASEATHIFFAILDKHMIERKKNVLGRENINYWKIFSGTLVVVQWANTPSVVPESGMRL